MSLKFNVIFVIFLMVLQSSYADDYSGTTSYSIQPVPIYHSGLRLINYGPVLINTADTLYVNFKNTGIKPLFIATVLPSFFLGRSPNDTISKNLWQSFTRAPNNPIVIDSTGSFKITFTAGDTVEGAAGWYEALCTIAFAKNDDRNTLISNPDSLILKAKKTPYYVAGYDDILEFDSVYVNPVYPKSLTWRLKNTWTNPITLDSQNIKAVSQNFYPDLFSYDTISSTVILPKAVLNWNLKYFPKTMGRDTALFKVYYRPDPGTFPDSVDHAFVFLNGVGVRQSLRLIRSFWDIKGDTIELSTTKLGQNIFIRAYLQNDGNIPFHSISQKIMENGNDSPFDSSFIVRPFEKDTPDLLPGETDSNLVFSITPKRLGDFIARYEIQSDLLDRPGIHGAQGSDSRKVIYVRGFVSSPILTFPDTVDFGTVILNSVDCPKTRDTTIKLYNRGNHPLVVSSLKLIPEGTDRFLIDNSGFTLLPGEYKTINISCDPGNDPEHITAKLIFNTLDNAPEDTISVTLLANGISRAPAELHLPSNVAAKPGNEITLPLMALSADKSKPAAFAQAFSCELVYDRSILEYRGIDRRGTASEEALNNSDLAENPDSISVKLSLSATGSDYFLPSDTLVNLKFKVYFGNALYTQVNIINPKFGDESCNNILTINKFNGSVVVDSVCNPEDLLNSLNKRFDLKIIVPQPADNAVNIQYTLANSCRINFEIFDSFGNSALLFPIKEGVKGINNESLDITGLPSGFYFLRLSSTDYTTAGRFILIR